MDVIVNCTPLGMAPHLGEAPVRVKAFERFDAAVDLIYNPGETAFLRMAREQGLKTLNGLGMLAFQGMKSFEIWTGIKPADEIADEIMRSLSNRL
jgi:shikimate dehydrogenase